MYEKANSGDDDREPFLADSEDHHSRGHPAGFWRRINYAAIATHCTIALLYLMLITGTSRFNDTSSNERASSVDIYSPAGDAIEYHLVDFPLRDFYHDNPYVGDPRPEHDKAWSKLLKNMNVRFTQEEMSRMNLTSLRLKDGSGYVGSFTAYHEIHCVHWIRKWMHREHYWPYLEGDALRERKVHIEHCLENLRLNAMCRGSRAVSTFEWMGAFPRPTVEQKHKCINWEKFDAWNAKRRVDLFDLDALADRSQVSSTEEADVGVRLGSKPKPETSPRGKLRA